MGEMNTTAVFFSIQSRINIAKCTAMSHRSVNVPEHELPDLSPAGMMNIVPGGHTVLKIPATTLL